MKIKPIVIMLRCALLLAFSGCGKKNDTDADSGATAKDKDAAAAIVMDIL
jgi:hypothetical protein